jgi:hypothetical protein
MIDTACPTRIPSEDWLAAEYENAFEMADPGEFTAPGSKLGKYNRHRAALRALAFAILSYQ